MISKSNKQIYPIDFCIESKDSKLNSAEAITNTIKEKEKKQIVELLFNSTVICISKMMRSSNSFVKIMWFTVFIISTSCCGFYTIKNISDYLKKIYSTVTSIQEINEHQSQFPTISFCSYPSFNTTIDQFISKSSFEKVPLVDLKKFFEEFNDSTYGRCFRFNSGKNMLNKKIPLFNSTKSGYQGRFSMHFNFEVQNEYDFSEILLQIHNHSSPPNDMENEVYFLNPGSLNYFEIERVFNEQLEEPYNECLKDVRQFKLNKTIIEHIFETDRIYSQNYCFNMCSNLFALEESNCSCNSTWSRFDQECIRKAFDSETDMTHCVADYLQEFRKSQSKKCKKYCPLECDSLSYSIIPYSESILYSGNISAKRKTDATYAKFNMYEETRQKYIYVAVYYKNLKYTFVSQNPKIETFNFISNIGGTLSLFMGISFLSLIEIFEIFIEAFFFLLVRIK
jgi:hypothetical protein